MAASFGEKLLQEVHEEGLDELLRDLRALYYENVESTRTGRASQLGVAPIDGLLEIFMPSTVRPPSEQHIIEQSTLHTHSEAPIQPLLYVNPTNPVLEISSTSSAAGKSQLIYYLTALAVLPPKYSGIILGGHAAAVVFIDADGRFDAERLRNIARGIVEDKLRKKPETTPVGDIPGRTVNPTMDQCLEALLLASLQHVHVFRPQSSLALLYTLQSLDTYLLDLSRHVSANRRVHSIIVDSATAFYWQDKLQDEVARTEDIGRPIDELERERREQKSFYLADMYADLVTALKRVQRLFDCAIIYTSTSLAGKSVGKPGAPLDAYNPLDTVLPNMVSFRSSLPPPWGLFPTLRLVVQRDMVRPFPPTMSIRDAQKDAQMRHEVVMQGKFVGSVNGWGREDWPRRVLEGVKRLDGGQFVFQVGRDGVTF
ncbi:hypothetical protein AOCH_006346 [Aspergillus ochraceoroseus]|nr:hypothetical protein AOCH_006346 [Aspergillus ochraceoroseus]